MAFELDTTEEKVALKELLTRAGYNIEREFGSVGDPIYKMIGDKCVASNVMLYMGEDLEMLDLKTLTESWRLELVNQFEKSKLHLEERLNPVSAKEKRDLFSWLKSACLKTSDGATVCIFCGLVCYPQSSSSNFNSHAKTHLLRETGKKIDAYKAKRTACPQCNKMYRPDALKKHMWNVHRISLDEEVKLKECLFCQKMFHGREKGKHILSEHKNDTIKCKECKGTFTNEDKFTMHMRNVHVESIPEWCETCQKNVQKMGRHKAYYHRSSKSLCTHCQKTFRDSTSLKIHMKSVDGTVVRKKCDECFKSFTNLRDHVIGVHRKQLKPHQMRNSKCFTCYRWIDKADFDGHQLICATDMKTCDLCGIEVKRQKFDFHVTKNHAKCTICNKESGKGKRNGLRDHIFNRHMSDIFRELGLTGAKEMTDDLREREVIAQLFVKNKSEKEKDKFKCKLCNKLFSTLTVMLNHMKFHLNWNNSRQKILKVACSSCGKVIRKGNVFDKHSCSAS